MSELLTEIRERATQRASELKRDIRQAEELIALYEEELTPLLAILAATDPPHPPTGTAEAFAVAVDAAGEGSTRAVVYEKATPLPEEPRHPHTGEVLAKQPATTGTSEAMLRVVALNKIVAEGMAAKPKGKVPKRWSQYKLPPRVRLFLNKFGNINGQIQCQQVMDWYITVSPDIEPSSLKQAAVDITSTLINKGILHRDAPGTYPFAKN